jgi:benzoate-CoA ligase
MYWGYTSGSTGAPKAALHTHAELVAAADLVGVGIYGLGPDDLVFSASKTSFAFGLGNTLYFPARVGAAALLVSERLEAEALLETIERERPTVFCAVPTLYARMLQVERRVDLSSLRLCVSSGEVLPPAVSDAWQARFGLELANVLGSTEALHDFIASRPGAVRRGSVGQVVPGFEARVVDDEGRPVPPGQLGHLLIKGPTTALAYWQRRERTRRAMLGEWLATGDMVWCDADGYFFLAGRADDMLKVGGQWVSPSEIESRLAEHPAVLEAAVVERQDGAGLTALRAFVALKPGAVASAEDLRSWVRAGLPGFKAPRWIELVPELPRTATGKIQRFRLRASP